MWQTFGHQNQKLFLDNSIKNSRLSHAYLFYGPSAAGKRTLAIEFAKKILAVPDQAQINPDLILRDGSEMNVEKVRSLIYDLSLKPFQYAYKIAIIDNFENVSEDAASSILKTLEEPNQSSILILIAQNKENLLKTIVSRCQTLYFNALSESELTQFLQKRKINYKDFSGINGGKIMKLIEDKDYAENFTEALKQFQAIIKKDPISRISEIKALSEKEPQELGELFGHWLDYEKSLFLKGASEKYKNLELLIEAARSVKQNLNKKLILQKLFLNIA